ncbi:MAG TPA: winged helix-turn-helix domain-containing protein [Steroidobacteraceae bacterium]
MNYTLGDLTIDTGRQQVSRGARALPLPKLSYDLLLALVRAAPNVVSLNELMRLVWPGIVVSPETVSQRIKMLRDAIGDDAREPRYIGGLRGRGYQMVAAVEQTTHSSSTLPAMTISSQSVAVLPFLDMSELQDQEYFADGLAEELINLLAKIPDMRVPARTSSFYFKGKSEDIPAIARRLMVAHVLEGSVHKSGDRLRVTAQLVRADNGYHLWSESYDRRFDDVFKVQDDIAGCVVKALQVKLLDAQIHHPAPTANSEAYTLYLQAESLIKHHTSEDSLRAYDCLRQALELDANFAVAWAALAELYTDDNVMWSKRFSLDESDGQNIDLATRDFLLGTTKLSGAAKTAGARALALDPDAADIHRALASVVLFFDFNWDAADAGLKKARALDPGNARITEQSARLAIAMGRLTEGLALANLAVSMDPLGTAYWAVGSAHHRLGALERAAAAYRRLIELHPTMPGAHFRYGLVLLSQGQPQAALEQMERDEPWYQQTGVALALDALGRRAEADRAQALAETNWGNGMAYQLSYIYAARGEQDTSIAWLERASRQRDAGILSMAHDPMVASLTGNPAFKALQRKLKLPL